MTIASGTRSRDDRALYDRLPARCPDEAVFQSLAEVMSKARRVDRLVSHREEIGRCFRHYSHYSCPQVEPKVRPLLPTVETSGHHYFRRADGYYPVRRP